jgi:hypothetical protein
MRMVITLIALSTWKVQGDIDGAAVAVSQRPGEGNRRCFAALGAQFCGKGYLPLAGRPSIATLL